MVLDAKQIFSYTKFLGGKWANSGLSSISIGSVLPWENQKDRELDISCEAFAGYFTNKILLLYHDLPATLEAAVELESPWLAQESSLQSTLTGRVGRILLSVKPTTCALEPCPSWLVKAYTDSMSPPPEIVNLSLNTSAHHTAGLMRIRASHHFNGFKWEAVLV